MRRKFSTRLALGGLAALIVASGVFGVRALLRGKTLAVGGFQEPRDETRAPVPLQIAEKIYEGGLREGWEDWGWGSRQLGGGPARIVFRDYGGIVLHHAELSASFGGLSFRFKAPPGYGDFLQVTLGLGAERGTFPVVSVRRAHVAQVEGWNEVLVDFRELNPKGQNFDRVVISGRIQVGAEPVELDRILLTSPGGNAGEARPSGSLTVSCSAAGKPISDLVYGGSRDTWSSGQSARRIGGNPLSRANWELGVWNVGKDWYFENHAQKTNLFQEIEGAAQQGQRLAVVVPLLGWVAKDGTSSGFPRAKFPSQRAFDQYRSEAGDGMTADGKPIAPGEPGETSVPASPQLIEQWVRKVVAADAARGARSQRIYILDNEPSLWNVTHRDVHPEPLGYDELLKRTIDYATAIRTADPEASIAGPAEWGWVNYHESAIDRDAGGGRKPDRQAHGDMPLVPWYLSKLAEHEKATGKRLLDILDLHFYPAANGIYEGNAVDATASALRLRSTRALWDPTYRDESWINEPIALIPRMKKWVSDYYPGRKVMIGEWSFGAEGHLSGGLAVAEALGRFGEHGLDAAFFWGELKETEPVYWAFRAYRNFDGKGGRFLDWSVPVEGSGAVSVFASRNESKSQLVLVLVNRQPGTKISADITLKGCGRVATSRLFAYGPGSTQLSAGESTITPEGVRASLEPDSFAVLDLTVER